jgi:hypothetical protein
MASAPPVGFGYLANRSRPSEVDAGVGLTRVAHCFLFGPIPTRSQATDTRVAEKAKPAERRNTLD